MASLTRQFHRRLTREQHRTCRHHQVQWARATRRRLDRIHQHLPKQVHAVLDPLESAFSRPTHRRFLVLGVVAILTLGGRTIANLLRCLGALAPGHSSSYHRVFSHRRWSSWKLARQFAHTVLARFLPQGPIELAGDDTVTEHPGPHVYGKGCHRDPVRSTHSYTAYRWGHKWVALTVLVKVPWATRRWALPLLIVLYQTPEANCAQKRRHKTPSQLMRQILRVLLRWFPERTFVITGDGNYATHKLAELTTRYPGRLTLVSKFYPTANLTSPKPPSAGRRRSRGRPRVKGSKLPSPATVVQGTSSRQPLEVSWYGGGRRSVEVVTGKGCWYESGGKLVPVLWVFVHDRSGTHREEYFFTTDPTMSSKMVIETYTGRWNIETMFQEVRSYLGLETTRGWSRNTVLRVGPCLFGLYTVVALLYSGLPARYARVHVVDWPGKRDTTFSDAITAVRRWLWVEWVFAIPGHREAFSKLSSPFRQILLHGLAPAA
jgi:DDE superfamily endonuclease